MSTVLQQSKCLVCIQTEKEIPVILVIQNYSACWEGISFVFVQMTGTVCGILYSHTKFCNKIITFDISRGLKILLDMRKMWS